MTFSCWIKRAAKVLPFCFALAAFGLRSEPLPPIVANSNHSPAGTLRDGVLQIQLEIARGGWRPEADDGRVLSVYAFGEVGRSLQNPGPLVRVPQGTEIRASLHNSLSVPVTVHGLGDAKDGDAAVRVAPGMTEKVRFAATTPGLFFYWGAAEGEDLKLRYGIDAELTGALVVDPPGAHADDEIFVIELMSEHPGLTALKTLATVNGKSWPYTQRFQYDVGQPVKWRWINATNEPHALHLHGFYFRVDAFNRGGRVEAYEGDSRPMVVTQRVAQGETFDMSWSPTRPGRWLFHCHMLLHMTPPIIPEVPGLVAQPPLTTTSEHAAMHDSDGMGQMVLGISVPDPEKSTAAPDWHPDRKLQLMISERTGIPRYALQLYEGAQAPNSSAKPGLIGPPIILTRGQPVEIDVVNRLTQPTAIHWHGIELESYYDGVPGWSGSSTEITPLIAPRGSFTVRMTPPRAGTFIYHTHWHDPSQLLNGIYGPLIVLPPREKFDPTSDLIFVFSLGDFDALHNLALINGTPQAKTMQLQAGKKYRLRFINISTNNQGMQVSLRDAKGPVEWRVIAKDAIDRPGNAVQSTPAQLTVSVGETYDVEFSTPRPQELLLELLLPGQKIHIAQTLLFAPAVQAKGVE